MIYVGLAGATRSRSGRKSANTLYGRLATMHLGRKRNFSTFRVSLTAILSAHRSAVISEAELTEWMMAHLRVKPVPVVDADRLDQLETTVLTAIDPPLNLAKMPNSPVRQRLSLLRKAIRD